MLSPFLDVGRVLFCDNFYTNVEVAENLAKRNTKICGTYRKNRKCYPKCLNSKQLKKGEVAGVQKGVVKVIKWIDKRPVSILSTCPEHDSVLVETGKIDRNNIEIKKPQCVLDYNKAKKGVDLSDQMSSYQSPLRKGLKWYRKVAAELLFGAAITNAWLIYNNKFPDAKMSILDFRTQICKAFAEDNEVPRPRTPKRIHTLTESGPDNKKRKKCKGCYQLLRQTMSSREADNKVKKVYTYCAECENNPGFCLRCFNIYHEQFNK